MKLPLFFLLCETFTLGLPSYSQQTVANQNDELPGKIVNAAKNCVGKKMWFGFGLSGGLYGCAAAVSNVLNKAGVKDTHSKSIFMQRAMWPPTSFFSERTEIAQLLCLMLLVMRRMNQQGPAIHRKLWEISISFNQSRKASHIGATFLS